jgi:CDP-diacylglycerol--glycerol-3-phosphate 3-phosphatidyltransferase
MTLANKLTFLRILLTLLSIAMLAISTQLTLILALTFFLLGSLTDLVDGRVARARKEVTELGIFLDPLVDKIMVLSILITLQHFGVFPYWMVILVFLREIIVTSFRDFAARKSVSVPSVISGKIKSVLQDIAISAGMFSLILTSFDLSEPAEFLETLAISVLATAILVGFYGMVVILLSNFRKVIG